MNPTLHYARMAEAHWREHCPRRVADLEASGQLQTALEEAHQETSDEMAKMIRDCLAKGLTPEQAECQAWERVRENYVLLPPEESE